LPLTRKILKTHSGWPWVEETHHTIWAIGCVVVFTNPGMP
jgi:hypothetical protein